MKKGLENPETPEPEPERRPADELSRMLDGFDRTDALDAAELPADARDIRTLAEAKDYAERRLGIEYANYEGFDQRTANEVNASLEELQGLYPDVGKPRWVGTIQHRNETVMKKLPRAAGHPAFAPVDEGTIAETLTGADRFDGIAVNEAWARDHAATVEYLRQNVEGGHFQPGGASIEAVVTHEYGHVIAADLEARGRYAETVGPVVEDLWARGRDFLESNVGGYAARSRDELIAEAFAEYRTSPEPRQPASAIGEAIDGAYARQSTGRMGER